MAGSSSGLRFPRRLSTARLLAVIWLDCRSLGARYASAQRHSVRSDVPHPGWQVGSVASVLVRKRRACKSSRRRRNRDAFGQNSLVRVVSWNLNYQDIAGARPQGELLRELKPGLILLH